MAAQPLNRNLFQGIANGEPLPFGRVELYIVGSNTLIDIYKTSTVDSSNQWDNNQAQLDASGYASIFTNTTETRAKVILYRKNVDDTYSPVSQRVYDIGSSGINVGDFAPTGTISGSPSTLAALGNSLIALFQESGGTFSSTGIYRLPEILINIATTFARPAGSYPELKAFFEQHPLASVPTGMIVEDARENRYKLRASALWETGNNFFNTAPDRDRSNFATSGIETTYGVWERLTDQSSTLTVFPLGHILATPVFDTESKVATAYGGTWRECKGTLIMRSNFTAFSAEFLDNEAVYNASSLRILSVSTNKYAEDVRNKTAVAHLTTNPNGLSSTHWLLPDLRGMAFIGDDANMAVNPKTNVRGSVGTKEISTDFSPHYNQQGMSGGLDYSMFGTTDYERPANWTPEGMDAQTPFESHASGTSLYLREIPSHTHGILVGAGGSNITDSNDRTRSPPAGRGAETSPHTKNNPLSNRVGTAFPTITADDSTRDMVGIHLAAPGFGDGDYITADERGKTLDANKLYRSGEFTGFIWGFTDARGNAVVRAENETTLESSHPTNPVEMAYVYCGSNRAPFLTIEGGFRFSGTAVDQALEAPAHFDSIGVNSDTDYGTGIGAYKSYDRINLDRDSTHNSDQEVNHGANHTQWERGVAVADAIKKGVGQKHYHLIEQNFLANLPPNVRVKYFIRVG